MDVTLRIYCLYQRRDILQTLVSVLKKLRNTKQNCPKYFGNRQRRAPHWFTMGRPTFAPKITPPVDRSPNPTTRLIPGPIRPTISNHVLIRSAVLSQCTGQKDRHTHRPTDGWRECSMTIGCFRSIESGDTP